MRFYRLHVKRSGDESDGYLWFTSRRDAEKAKREQNKFAREEGLDATEEVESVQVEPTREGILRALEEYASHADNG